MGIFNRTAFLKSTDAIVGYWLCRILGRVNFLVHGDSPTAPINPEQIRRILVIRPGGMGDMVLLLPVIAILKETYPNAVVDIVCEKRNKPVLKLAGMTENVLVYDSNPLKFLWQLRHRKYDVAIDTEQFHNFSAIFALRSRARTRIGFKINPIRNPLYTHLVNYAPDGPEGEQFMRLLEPIGITNTCYDLEGALDDLKLELPASVSAEIKSASGAKGYAVIHAGASSIHKLWAADNYAELAKLLHEKRNVGVVLVGGRGDRKVNKRISEKARQSGGGIVSVAGDLDLESTAAVIAHAAVFVGSDSGLAHLAVALGIPTVVLFGPSDHLKWGFEDNHRAVVRSNLPCSPCFIFGYHKPCRRIACMSRITVEQVLLAVEKVM